MTVNELFCDVKLHKQEAVDCFLIENNNFYQTGEVSQKMTVFGELKEDLHERIKKTTEISNAEKNKYTSVVLDKKKRPLEEKTLEKPKKKKEK